MVLVVVYIIQSHIVTVYIIIDLISNLIPLLMATLILQEQPIIIIRDGWREVAIMIIMILLALLSNKSRTLNIIKVSSSSPIEILGIVILV